MASIRNFIVSFFLSLVLFSVVAYFSVDYMVDVMNKTNDDSEEQSGTDELNRLTSDATGILNLLLIGTDEYEYSESTGDASQGAFGQLADADRKNYDTKIMFMTLVSYNSYRQQVTVTAFPTEMTVPANNWELDLDSAYYFSDKELYGLTKDYFVHAISATIGIQIDYSATIDIDDYVKVADNLNGLTVDCPESDSDIGVIAGKNPLSSEQLYELLTKENYSEIGSKTAFVTNVTTAALDRICSTAYYMDAYREFERISPMLKNTEFDEEALTQWRSLIFSYKFYTLHKLSPLGTYETENGETVFKIDRSGTVNYFKQYMQNDQT